MAATLLDGTALAALVREELSGRVAACRVRPRLAVVLVGDNPASAVYVKKKGEAAEKVGIETTVHRFPKDVAPQVVAEAITDLNRSTAVHGILVQLPLPPHLDTEALLRLVDPSKDVDGLHPHNLGLLLRGQRCFLPATPRGCMALLDLAVRGSLPPAFSTLQRATLAGKHAVVIGRSALVGKPTALLLLERDASVTVVHSKTNDLPRFCREGDIVIAAVGVKHLVQPSWIKPGAIVIDVGINKGSDGKLYGDVAPGVAEVAGALSPVPGGVGPLTVAFLLDNVVQGAS